MVVEWIQANPRIGILVISALISLFITLINYFVMDKEKMKKMKSRQKELNAQMKEHKHDQNKMVELQKEMMRHVGENFKHSFKPMLITIVPIIIVFGWVKNIFSETAIASSWFWWYIGGAIAASMIFRKLFKLP
jgi:uncharacterized membrane protein (DUF106 family)